MTAPVSRAQRNANPLNLRPSGDKWIGLREPQTDPGYLQFVSNFYGLRAGAINLLTYFRTYRLDTIRKIVSRWAPPSDNNPTTSYIEFVARETGFGPDQPLDLERIDSLRALMKAMIKFEGGSQPYSDEAINAAIIAAYRRDGAPQVPEEPKQPEPAPAPSQPPPAPIPAPEPVPEQPPMPIPPKPRDEIVPPPTKPPLVDQPTPAPTRKVVAGGLAGALAFVTMVGWNRIFPEAPIPADYATAIGGAAVYAATLVTQYFVRNRSTDIPPAPATTSPRVEYDEAAK